MNRMALNVILGVTVCVTAACSTLGGSPNLIACPAMPPMPAKPMLPSLTATEDGGIILDAVDAGRLGQYILNLERGYNQ